MWAEAPLMLFTHCSYTLHISSFSVQSLRVVEADLRGSWRFAVGSSQFEVSDLLQQTQTAVSSGQLAFSQAATGKSFQHRLTIGLKVHRGLREAKRRAEGVT